MRSVRDENECSEQDNPIHLLMAREMRRRLDVSLMRLRLRTRAVIFWHFGLVGREKTMRDIARELRISPARVGQIVHKTLAQLKNGSALKAYGDVSDLTLEALKHIDAPPLTLFTAGSKTSRGDAFPERTAGIDDYLSRRAAIKKAEQEL